MQLRNFAVSTSQVNFFTRFYPQIRLRLNFSEEAKSDFRQKSNF